RIIVLPRGRRSACDRRGGHGRTRRRRLERMGSSRRPPNVRYRPHSGGRRLEGHLGAAAAERLSKGGLWATGRWALGSGQKGIQGFDRQAKLGIEIRRS